MRSTWYLISCDIQNSQSHAKLEKESTVANPYAFSMQFMMRTLKFATIRHMYGEFIVVFPLVLVENLRWHIKGSQSLSRF